MFTWTRLGHWLPVGLRPTSTVTLALERCATAEVRELWEELLSQGLMMNPCWDSVSLGTWQVT